MKKSTDKIDANILLGEHVLTIPMDRDKEELFRKAGHLVQSRYAFYQEEMNVKRSSVDCMALAAFEIASEYLLERKRNDTEPYKTILSELTEELKAVL